MAMQNRTDTSFFIVIPPKFIVFWGLIYAETAEITKNIYFFTFFVP